MEEERKEPKLFHLIYGGAQVYIPKNKDHPIKTLIKVLDFNSEKLSYSNLMEEERENLIKFIEELKKTGIHGI